MPYKSVRKRNEYQKIYRALNWEEISKKSKLRNKIWRQNNKEQKKKYQKEYVIKNRLKINSYVRNKRRNDLSFRLKANLRTRLYSIIRHNSKRGSAIKDLGCTVPEFIKYIESNFKVGMDWKNWGRYGWHIDHIKPLTAFDLNNKEELKKAVNYKNLQPLWWNENISKGGYKK